MGRVQRAVEGLVIVLITTKKSLNNFIHLLRIIWFFIALSMRNFYNELSTGLGPSLRVCFAAHSSSVVRPNPPPSYLPLHFPFKVIVPTSSAGFLHRARRASPVSHHIFCTMQSLIPRRWELTVSDSFQPVLDAFARYRPSQPPDFVWRGYICVHVTLCLSGELG